MKKLEELRNELVEHNLGAEILGHFIWVSGNNTYKEREYLKSLGFRWSRNKAMWYYTDIPFTKKTDKDFTIDELRQIYNKSQLMRVV